MLSQTAPYSRLRRGGVPHLQSPPHARAASRSRRLFINPLLLCAATLPLPPFNPIRGSEERCKLPQRGLYRQTHFEIKNISWYKNTHKTLYIYISVAYAAGIWGFKPTLGMIFLITAQYYANGCKCMSVFVTYICNH